MPVKPKPDQYHSVTPYLIVTGAARLIEFAKAAFGAEETERLAAPEGRIGHAELRIGDSLVMLADAPARGPPMPCMLHLYVDDADATYRRALMPARPRWNRRRISSMATQRPGVGSERQFVVDRDAYRGCAAGRTEATRCSGDAGGGRVTERAHSARLSHMVMVELGGPLRSKCRGTLAGPMRPQGPFVLTKLKEDQEEPQRRISCYRGVWQFQGIGTEA